MGCKATDKYARGQVKQVHAQERKRALGVPAGRVEALAID